QGGKFQIKEIAVQTDYEKMIVPLEKQCERQNHRSVVQLYDLSKDPKELSNGAVEGLPVQGKQLHQQLLEWHQNSQQSHARLSNKSQETMEISEHEIKKLKALGYLSD
ncbi:MAG TPA: hypothetical protein VJ024_04290, partial [Thermodesulfovibrionales bacterium]|nr:hypothetical protein [Thermodesulfovibrionales bacterium]